MHKKTKILHTLPALCIIFCNYFTYAADFNPDTSWVEIWTKHDLGYVTDTVQCITWHRLEGRQWYLKTVGGERYSDREPREIIPILDPPSPYQYGNLGLWDEIPDNAILTKQEVK